MVTLEWKIKLISGHFRHVTHKILQERNLEGQTLLAIIEVNRWTIILILHRNAITTQHQWSI